MQKINEKVWNWASSYDPNAMLQAERVGRLPFVEGVRLMPDMHYGMGATVGSVIGTNGAIIPSAVGVDIGCGMMAVQWDMVASELPDDLEAFMPHVSRSIPAGVGQGHEHTSSRADTWWKTNRDRFQTEIDADLSKKATTQFGSLGSGNHFFEICLDENDSVWFVLHSGSRGLGNIVASRHIKEAKKFNKELNRSLEDTDLAYFLDDDPGFTAYITDMLACQDYAAENRNQMMRSVTKAWKEFIGRPLATKLSVNCHHNFTEPEMHGGKKIWVTRKGAIKADIGDLGVIPGSMGTRSYIVRGLGNADSYCSCSHGAGRVHSRSAAKKLFTTDDLRASMEGKVWNASRADSLVDEIPASYKDIDVVMEDQKDLVAPIFQLHQILNYKGC
jgi:RNA-splicing ligase RtcB